MSEHAELFREAQTERSGSDKVLLRPMEGGAGERTALPQMRTSLSIIAADPADADGVIEQLAAWDTTGIRVEMLVVGDRRARLPEPLRERLAARGVVHRIVEAPDTGVEDRAAMLAAAVENAMFEVVAVVGPSIGPLELVNRALWWQWVDGADVALLPTQESDMVGDDSEAAAELAAWLGFGRAGTAAGPRVVLMRRWVARWVFSELERALSPAEELADRARLLGLSVVRLCRATTVTPAPQTRRSEGSGDSLSC